MSWPWKLLYIMVIIWAIWIVGGDLGKKAVNKMKCGHCTKVDWRGRVCEDDKL